MRKRFFIPTVILVVILLTACSAGSTEETGIEVHQVTMDAAAQGENSNVFMAMHNHGSETDQLTGVSTGAAESTQLQNDEEIVQDIPVYANTELEFTHDGYHVVMVGVKQELHAGDEIEVVLQFRDHEDITVKATVGEAAEHEHQ
jgi:periplasmic copper chaperone A